MKKRYRVRIPEEFQTRYQGQKRLSKYFEDDASGQAWVDEEEAKLSKLRIGGERESIVGVKAKEITLEQACEGWLASLQRRPRSIQSYEWTLVHPYRLDRAHLLSRYDLAHWDVYCAERRKAGGSEDALLRERQAIQAAAKWAAARGFAVHAQIFAIPRPNPIPTVVRRYDPERMFAAVAKLEGRYRAIAELAIGTGMRSAELRCARVEWARWAQGYIEIPHSQEFANKGGRPRKLPLSKKLQAILREWVGDRIEGLIFEPAARQRAGTGFAAWRVIKAIRDAGMPISGLHDLRHHYISHLAARGVDLRTIQELAGHRQSATTDLYMHTAPGYLDKARKALDEEDDSGPDSGPKKRAQ